MYFTHLASGELMDAFAALFSLAFALGDHHAAWLAPTEVEFPFDDALRLLDGQKNGGKVWRSPYLPNNGNKVPVVVFLHGILFDGQRHHWLSVDPSGPWGDARPTLSDLVSSGVVEPLVAAVPSQTRDAEDPSHMFVGFDLDKFIDQVDEAIQPLQRVDRSRIVVVGHSASACDHFHGAFTTLRPSTANQPPLRALFGVDGCLEEHGAALLVTTNRARDVIVTYEDDVWPERTIYGFRMQWMTAARDYTGPGLRIFERLEPGGSNSHMTIMAATLQRWLPWVLPPTSARSGSENTNATLDLPWNLNAAFVGVSSVPG